MAWYTGITEGYDKVTGAVGGVFDEYIKALSERSSEQISGAVKEKEETPDGVKKPINYGKAAVAIGATGLILSVVR